MTEGAGATGAAEAIFTAAVGEIMRLIEAQPPTSRPALLASVVVTAASWYGDPPIAMLRRFNAHTLAMLADLGATSPTPLSARHVCVPDVLPRVSRTGPLPRRRR